MRNELNTLRAHTYNERLNFFFLLLYINGVSIWDGISIYIILIIMVLKRGLKDKEIRKYHTAILTHWDTTQNKNANKNMKKCKELCVIYIWNGKCEI